MDKLSIYGKQPVLEALKSDYSIYRLWYSKDYPQKFIRQLENLTRNKNINKRAVHKNEIQKLTGPVMHQGIAAEVEAVKVESYTQLMDYLDKITNPFILILDQVQDPHNMGAILRTAEIGGIHAVVMPEKGSAQLNETVAKTSAGALFHLNIFKVENLEHTIMGLNIKGISTMALMPWSEYSLYEKKLTSPVAIVVGSEGQGVRKNISKLCSDVITIPQYGRIKSLNASVATAVVLYEIIRQRNSDL